MNLRPVLERELRSQARSWENFGLRLIGAGSLLLLSGFIVVLLGDRAKAGPFFFGMLNCSVFFFIWGIVPLSVADVISFERREGTIGLLFLTPLKPAEIVTSKILAYAIRTSSIWLAALPVLTVPFLMGGIGKREVFMSTFNNFASICLALAAGILASASTKNRLRAQILALFLAGLFGAVFLSAGGLLLTRILNYPRFAGTVTYTIGQVSYGPLPYQYFLPTPEMTPITGFLGATDFLGCWSYMLPSAGEAVPRQWLILSAGLAVGSALVLVLCIIAAAAWLRRVWQEEPPSARQVWLEKKLVTPVFGVGLLRAWSRRQLARNPIGWLEQRSWTGRLVMWSWMAVIVAVYAFSLKGDYSSWILVRIQNAMAWVLLLGLAASAANSFRRERESGVMELLLVSPLTEWQLVGGRIRGLYAQFLPAMLLLLCTHLYLRHAYAPLRDSFEDNNVTMEIVTFLVMPLVGLYASLRFKTFAAAFLAALAMAIVLPGLVSGLGLVPLLGLGATIWVECCQVAVAAFCLLALHRNLRQRSFAFQRQMS